MKTSFHRRNRLSRKVAAFLIAGIILLAFLRLSSESFRSWTRDLFVPILSFSSKIRYFFEDFGGNKISELESRTTELLLENYSLKKRLSELVPGVIDPENAQVFTRSSSLVLSQSPTAPYDTLLISFSPREVPKVGTKVTAKNGIYIGQISEVGVRSATVKLLSYPALETEAWLERSEINITLIGEGGYNLKFSLPKDVPVIIGDKVLSNTDPQFLIGQVENIHEKPVNPLKEIFLRFPFNFKSLRHVELVD